MSLYLLKLRPRTWSTYELIFSPTSSIVLNQSFTFEWPSHTKPSITWLPKVKRFRVANYLLTNVRPNSSYAIIYKRFVRGKHLDSIFNEKLTSWIMSLLHNIRNLTLHLKKSEPIMLVSPFLGFSLGLPLWFMAVKM